MACFVLTSGPVRDLLQQQDGVIARRQLHDLGARPFDLERLVRRRELTRAVAGVFLTHSGPPTQRQREWIAVLSAWPAALTSASAVPGLRSGRVAIVVGSGRSVRVPPWVDVRRADDLDARVHWHRYPPRVRVEHGILEVMSQHVHSHDVAGAFHALTQAMYQRPTTVERLLDTLQERPQLPGRALIRELLYDMRDGANSVLERQYMRTVEHAHGLPRGQRQVTSLADGRHTVQDILYPEFGLIVELDGFTYHQGRARDRDALRDMSELADTSRPTLRLTYGLAFSSPCRTARYLGRILQQRGWDGHPHTCYRCRRRPMEM